MRLASPLALNEPRHQGLLTVKAVQYLRGEADAFYDDVSEKYSATSVTRKVFSEDVIYSQCLKFPCSGGFILAEVNYEDRIGFRQPVSSLIERNAAGSEVDGNTRPGDQHR